MRKWWWLLVVSLGALSLMPVNSIAAGQQVVEIPVSGMVCEFCVYGVKKKLQNLDGVEKVQVSLEDKQARIIMAPNHGADIDAIRNAITDAGFTPGNAKTVTQ